MPANAQTPRTIIAIPASTITSLPQLDGGFGSYGSSGILFTFSRTNFNRDSIQDYRPQNLKSVQKVLKMTWEPQVISSGIVVNW